MAGCARGLMIGLIIALVIWLFYSTGVWTNWFEGIPVGIGAFMVMDFWIYLGIIVFIIGLISLFVRSMINWGGA